MASSPREMRLRMRSVANISQVTHALEAVSASKVRRAQQAARARPARHVQRDEVAAGQQQDFFSLQNLSQGPGHLLRGLFVLGTLDDGR